MFTSTLLLLAVLAQAPRTPDVMLGDAETLPIRTPADMLSDPGVIESDLPTAESYRVVATHVGLRRTEVMKDWLPAVIGAYESDGVVRIAGYEEALLIAKREARPLAVFVGTAEDAVAVDRLPYPLADAVVCEIPTHVSLAPGAYFYRPQGDKLVMVSGYKKAAEGLQQTWPVQVQQQQPKAVKTTETRIPGLPQGYRLQCGPRGCRPVPS